MLLGLGANLGNPRAQLRLAVHRINQLLAVDRVSALYRTEPVGDPSQQDYYNLVVVGRTGRPPHELMSALHQVEAKLGRVRPYPNAPRTIDIDLLAYGDLVIESRTLTVPHPRMHRRAFVLVPLLEVAPDWVHPVLGSGPAELLEALQSRDRVDRLVEQLA